MDQAEKLRTLVKDRTDINVHSKVIAVTSGKGGAGKSSTVLNMAINFSRMGKKVIILDTDFGLSNIEVMFGIYPKYTVSDFLFKGMDINEVVTSGYDNVGFISGGSAIVTLLNVDDIQRSKIVSKIKELEDACDILLIDTGAGISDAVLDFLVLSGEILLVTTPEPTSITDAYALVKALSVNDGFSRELTDIKVLCNKANSDKEAKIAFEKLNSVTSKFLEMELKYLGYIPYDNHISKAIMKQVPVTIEFPTSISSKAYSNIAKMVLDDELFEVNKGKGIEFLLSKYFLKK